MKVKSSFDIDELFQGYLEQLRVEAKYFTKSVTHPGEKGRLNETHFIAILRRYLPKRFGIGTGFIVSTNPHKKISPQCDIIIYDQQNNAPFYNSEAFSIYPIEIVYGVIEIKTDLSSKKEINDCFSKCVFIRQMAKEYISEEDYHQSKTDHKFGVQKDEIGRFARLFKGYFRYDGSKIISYYVPLSPRFFVFSYNGHKTRKGFSDHFLTATQKYPDAHIHGACVLNNKGGFYTHHVPYRSGEEKIGPVHGKGGFIEFLFSLPKAFDTMLLPHPNRLGNGFDMIDPKRYQLPVSDAELELPTKLPQR